MTSNPPTSKSNKPISLSLLSAYGFLAFPLAAAFIALQVIVPTHYAETTSLSLSAIGLIMLVARLWDMVTDPVVGMLSDRTSSPLGRRRLWILISIPLISISTYLLFNPSGDVGIAYLLVWTLLIYVSGTMAIIPMNAWGAELSSDYQQRNRITGSRAAFGILGTLCALSIPALIGDASSDNMSSTLYNITLLVIISSVIASLLLLYVPDNHPIELPSAPLSEALALLKQPSPFRKLLLSFLANGTANAIPATLFLFYLTYVLETPDKAGIVLFTYFACAAIAIPFWVKLARKKGKHTTWLISVASACFFFLWTPFLDSGDFWLYLVIVIGTGLTTGCDLMMPSSMNGDLVEWDAAKTGYRRPGLFFALWGTTSKLSYALAIGITFPLLDFFGFSANQDNTPESLQWLAILYGIPCILFKLIALWNMRNYPITQTEYETILSTTQKS